MSKSSGDETPNLSILTRIRRKISKEFVETPTCFIGAVLAIGDMLRQVIETIPGSSPHEAAPITKGAGNVPTSLLWPTLEYMMLQIVLCFAWSRMRYFVRGLSSGFRWSADAVFVIVAAYLTCLNAFHFTEFRVEVSGVHYSEFDMDLFAGFLLVTALMCPFTDETYVIYIYPGGRSQPWRQWLPSLVLLTFLYFVFCVLFREDFLLRLHEIWVAKP